MIGIQRNASEICPVEMQLAFPWGNTWHFIFPRILTTFVYISKFFSSFSGEQVLVGSRGKEFPETHAGGQGSVVNFTDDVKWRAFPSWPPSVPPLSVPPREKSAARPRQKPVSRVSAPCSSPVQSSPVQHLGSMACVSSCSPLLCCTLEKTSSFFKKTDQLPKFSLALDGFTPSS